MTFLVQQRVSEMHLWNFFIYGENRPQRSGGGSERSTGAAARLRSVMGQSGKALVLKGFPECLAVEAPVFWDSIFTMAVLPEKY
jgi:hypothetical protein